MKTQWRSVGDDARQCGYAEDPRLPGSLVTFGSAESTPGSIRMSEASAVAAMSESESARRASALTCISR